MAFAFGILFLSLVLSALKMKRLAFIITLAVLFFVVIAAFLIYMDFPLGGLIE
jgi:hypothetical protein